MIKTIILLCIGYFIDFYDLTIFSASYNNIIHDLFAISDSTQIQSLYLTISNYYNTGIFCGSIFFGVLADKFGRSTIIRYSILLYSIATLLSIISHNLQLFIILRFISGFGLATEFATSSVLIGELFNQKDATRYTGLLYFCGILGGMSATYISSISWQLMFFLGGISGIVLYLLRKNLHESTLFINLHTHDNRGKLNGYKYTISRGSVRHILFPLTNFIQFIRLLLLIIPFFFTISLMFIYPRFMAFTGNLSTLTHTLLLGFFIGNLIATLLANWLTNYLANYRIFIFLNTIAFAIILSSFSIVSKPWFFPYSILLGALGGLPTIWVQIALRSYGTNLRSSAVNLLNACARFSTVIFNSLAGIWILQPKTFTFNVITTVLLISALALYALYYTKNNYGSNIDYTHCL